MKLHGTISRDVDWTAYRIIDKIQTHHRLGEKGLVSERERMTQCRQIRMEPAGSNVLLFPNSKSILGTWNVRSMY